MDVKLRLMHHFQLKHTALTLSIFVHQLSFVVLHPLFYSTFSRLRQITEIILLELFFFPSAISVKFIVVASRRHPSPSHLSSCRLHFQHTSFFSHGDLLAWRGRVYTWDTKVHER